MLGLTFLGLVVKRLNNKLNGTSVSPNCNLHSIAQEVFIFLPLALTNTTEALSYHFGQVLLSKVIAGLGSSSLTLRGYVFSISGLLEIIPLSISKGT